MCEYCRDCFDDDTFEPNELLHKELLTLNGCMFGDIEVNVSSDHLNLEILVMGELVTLKRTKINFCPICGAKLVKAEGL